MRRVLLIITLLSFGFGPCQEVVYVDQPRDFGSYDSDTNLDLSPAACTGTLSFYCDISNPGACLNYADKRTQASQTCQFADEGICGDLRYIVVFAGDLETYYYNAQGSLVSVYIQSNTRTFCSGSTTIHYGQVLTCVHEQSRSLCDCDGGLCGGDAGTKIDLAGPGGDLHSSFDGGFIPTDLSGPSGDIGFAMRD